MRKEFLGMLVRDGRIRIRSVDNERIKSLLSSAAMNTKVVLSMKVTEENATVIFREVYESVRQLGDARWWSLGYEPWGSGGHEVCLEILKDMEVEQKTKLNFLDRFRQIRNEANYRGYKISVAQATEIANFWNEVGKEILGLLKKNL